MPNGFIFILENERDHFFRHDLEEQRAVLVLLDAMISDMDGWYACIKIIKHWAKVKRSQYLDSRNLRDKMHKAVLRQMII